MFGMLHKVIAQLMPVAVSSPLAELMLLASMVSDSKQAS